MGYMGFASAVSAGQGMGPRDFIWVAALGTAARGPVGLDDIRMALDDIVGQLWTPSGEVVGNCVEEMLRSGAVRLTQNRPEKIETTPQGRETLSVLLSIPFSRSGCLLSQVAHRLKMAFLDLVPESDRRYHLGSAIRACQCEISECERRILACSAQGAFGRLWLDHEAKRLHRDLSLLNAMAVQCGGALAAV